MAEGRLPPAQSNIFIIIILFLNYSVIMKINYRTVALFLATTLALSSQASVPASAATNLGISTSHKTRDCLSEEEVADIICDIIAHHIGWPSGSVYLEDTFEDLYVESITMLGIVTDCSAEFDVSYDSSIYAGYLHRTVQSFVEETYEMYINIYYFEKK